MFVWFLTFEAKSSTFKYALIVHAQDEFYGRIRAIEHVLYQMGQYGPEGQLEFIRQITEHSPDKVMTNSASIHFGF